MIPFVTRDIEEHTDPARKHSTRRGRRPEESFRFGRDELASQLKGCRAPQRDAAISVVVGMEITQRPFVSNKETRLTVTQPLVDLGK
jgi:hypothetical protein